MTIKDLRPNILLRQLSLALERRKSRRELRDLSEDRLRDIGLTKTQALLESKKPFWQSK